MMFRKYNWDLKDENSVSKGQTTLVLQQINAYFGFFPNDIYRPWIQWEITLIQNSKQDLDSK